MTDLRSLNQYITDQEQEEHRLQRGMVMLVMLTDQGRLSRRMGSALNSNTSNVDMKFAFKPNDSSGWHSVFHNMKQYFFSPPPLYGMLFLRVTPSIKFASTHLCTWLEEGTVIQSTVFFLRTY